jgi:hypothetical protein
MNYFYFFLLLFLAAILLVKPITFRILNAINDAESLKTIGYITLLLGPICLAFSLQDAYWYETMWRLVTFILGILLILRGLFIIFFEETFKKVLHLYQNNYWKFSIPFATMLVYLALIIISRDYLGPIKDIEECISDDYVNVVCNFHNPEDMIITPDEKFILVSELGGISPFGDHNVATFFRLMDLESKKTMIPNISYGEAEWGTEDCSRLSSEKFNLHGIDILERADGRFQIGAVNHFPRESIEMFELLNIGNSWAVKWKGCIPSDPDIYLNDITFKKDGTFYTTYMFDRSITWNKWLIAALLKVSTGHVKYWDGTSYSVLKKSKGGQPNGIALDEENNLLYIAYNQSDEIRAYDLIKQKNVKSRFVQGIDNITLSKDSVWVTEFNSQVGDDSVNCLELVACSLPFSIIELNKKDLIKKNTYSFSKVNFGLPTVALPVEKEVYIGSFHSDRIAYFLTN